MKKFYINEKEVKTVEKFLDEFAKNLFNYTEYITELLGVKLDLISEELSNLIELVRDGGEYELNGVNYKVK